MLAGNVTPVYLLSSQPNTISHFPVADATVIIALLYAEISNPGSLPNQKPLELSQPSSPAFRFRVSLYER